VRLRVLVLVVLGLSLAACGASQSVPPSTQNGFGIVTGFAEGCQAHFPVKPAHPRMKVGLFSGPSLVASEAIRSGDTYRFPVAPRSYRVTVLSNSKDIAAVAGRRATVGAGRKATVDVVVCVRVSSPVVTLP
jgi:hypothetical protein